VCGLSRPVERDGARLAPAPDLRFDLAGLDVIYDDREDLGPGGKFADAELLGCPLRLTAGKRSLASGELEAQVRRGQESRTLPLEGAADAAAELWRTLA